MHEIRNIIFDFGGVFIDVDYKKTENAFIAAGISNFHELYSQHHASTLFEDLETGKVNDIHFYDAVRKASGLPLTNDQINTCWNSMMGSYYPKAIEKAKELKGKYRLFLFSNTNIIHYNWFRSQYHEQFGKDDFEDLFEKAYYSHTSGVRKPYPEAYDRVLKDAGIKASETLFIDDTYINIEGAKKVGLQTIFLEPGMKVWEIEL